MLKRTIVALPGDGIGAIVLKQAVRVLDAAGFNAEYLYGDIGWEFWRKEGNPLPQRTLDMVAKHKVALFMTFLPFKRGPVTQVSSFRLPQYFFRL
jgi:isocitrate dehydrogenase (NAD+)